MPEIARFYGIVIKMFFKPKEHEQVTSMPFMESTWASSTSRPWR